MFNDEKVMLDQHVAEQRIAMSCLHSVRIEQLSFSFVIATISLL
jgi:hypothetical protein